MSIFVELRPELYDAAAFAAFAPAAGFSIGNARAMMWFSQLAYEIDKRPTIEAVAPQWGFTSVSVFVERKIAITATWAACGLIGERPDAVVLAFSGTDPVMWETLATNLNIRLTPDRDTHSGFQMALNAASEEIEQAVRLSRQGNKPLFVIGHSLGAALAVLAAQYAAGLPGGTPKGVYVYGMPRTGGERFRAGYNARLGQITYRLVHGDDIVARLPLSRIGFRHVGRMLACRSGERFDPATPLAAADSDDPQLAVGNADSLVSGIKAVFAGDIFSPSGPGTFGPLMTVIPRPFRDHFQDRYFAALAG